MKRYLVSYNYEDKQSNIEIDARDFSDAQARLRRLAFGKVEGEAVPLVGRAREFLSKIIGRSVNHG